MERTVIENSYLLVLNGKYYDVKLCQNDTATISILEGIIDNLIYLLDSYGIEEDEILDQFKDQTDVEEKEM